MAIRGDTIERIIGTVKAIALVLKQHHLNSLFPVNRSSNRISS